MNAIRLHRRARRRARLIRMCRSAAVVIAVAVVIGGAWAVRQVTATRTTGTTAAPASFSTDPALLPLPARSAWKPARAELTRLANTVYTDVTPPTSGRYTYTRTRSWSRDATAASPATAISVFDEQRWWASDQSGRQTRTSVTGWTPGTEPGPVQAPDRGGDTRYRAHTMPVVIPHLSDNVFLLSSQLADQEPPSDGPQATLRAVREVYRAHDPTARQRGALLQALADTDGLYNAGLVDGGPGRRGIAIVADSDRGATRDVAVIDPVSGRLLDYDTEWLRAPSAVNFATPALSDSLLFITSSHTDNLISPP